MINLPNKIKLLNKCPFSPIQYFGKKTNLFILFCFSAPRYVRVNTLVSSTEKVCTKLIADGWKQVKSKKKTGYEGFIERVRSLSDNEFMMDFHLDFLLVFPSSAQFHNHELLKSGSILLQDKVCLNQLFLFGVIIFFEFLRQVVCRQWHYRLNHFTAR